MSIQSSLVSLLTSVASGQVYPDAAPQDVDLPFVIYRRTGVDETYSTSGVLLVTNSTMVFECYAATFTEALSVAAAVRSAVQGSSLTWAPAPGPGEDYEPIIDGYMEPVHFAFWH